MVVGIAERDAQKRAEEEGAPRKRRCIRPVENARDRARIEAPFRAGRVALVFQRRCDTKGLTEIFLVNSSDQSVLDPPIVTFDEQAAICADFKNLGADHRLTRGPGSDPQEREFTLNEAPLVRARHLQGVGRGRSVFGKQKGPFVNGERDFP